MKQIMIQLFASLFLMVSLAFTTTASARESICYACHYGDLLDKGGDCTLWMDHAHPVYVKPSDKIVIPSNFNFPLDDKGRIYCGTCHSLVIKSTDEVKNPWTYTGKLGLNVNNSDSFMCKLCHANMLKQKDAPESEEVPLFDHPQEILVKRPSRKLIEAGGKFGTSTRLVICETCHTMHNSQGKKLLVMKNKQGQFCSQCHARANAFSLKQARNKHIHPVNVVPRKALITERLISLGAAQGEQGQMTCFTCHRLHDSPVKQSLLLISNRNSELCAECHTDKLKYITGTGHDFKAPASTDRKKETGVCNACHLTHRDNSAGINEGTSAFKDRVSRLCAQCHIEKGPAEQKISIRFSHPTGTPYLSKKAGSLPLFSKEGDRKADGLVTCATCHDPHQATPRKKEAKPSNRNYFLRIANERSGLCRQCHQSELTIIRTPHDPAVSLKSGAGAPPLVKNLEKGRGLCRQCHSSHGSGTVKLWNREFPDDKGAIAKVDFGDNDLVSRLLEGNIIKTVYDNPDHVYFKEEIEDGYQLSDLLEQIGLYEEIDLVLDIWERSREETGDTISRICLSCHKEKMIAQKHLVGDYSHPVKVGLESLKLAGDPELPLFDTQYRRSKSGKMYCNTCHDLHQWFPNQKKPLKKRPGEGTKSSSFLRAAVGDSPSSLCGRCHPGQTGNIVGTKHDLRLSAPGETNLKGSTSRKSGVCGACHQIHNASGSQIWAKSLTGQGNITSDQCFSCHQKGKIAEQKLTGKFSHPVGVPNLPNLEEKQLPLFSEKGKIISEGGQVTCATCHDPHQEKPKQSGDSQSGNFLRAVYESRKDSLCFRCHKEERWIYDTDHDLNISASLARNAKGKLPKEIPICQTCHAVHNAETAFRLWNRSIGNGANRISQLCRSCHSSGKNAADKALHGYSHPEGADMVKTSHDIDFASLPLPVYDDEYRVANRYLKKGDKPPAIGKIYCSSCHQVHKWQADQDKYGSGQKTEGNHSNSFLRKNNSPQPELCRLCHPDQLRIIGSKHDLTISSPKHRNIKGQLPSESGVCGGCHLTHNVESDNHFWTSDPDKSKDDRISQYCGSCHRKGKLAANLVVGKNSHPIGFKIKSYLPNKLPLYFKNGKRNDKKGRITCYTCHDIHRQLSQPSGDLVSQAILAYRKAGRNYDFLRTEKIGSPDLCQNCHPDEVKIVHTSHDLTSKGTLVCSGCHKMHKAKFKKYLWNLKPGPKLLPGWSNELARIREADARLCSGCHSPKGSAANSVPRKGFHKPDLDFIQKTVKLIYPKFPYPVYEFKDREKIIKITSTAIIKGVPARYPLYSPKGGKSLRGSISCPTCHDVHVWGSDSPSDKQSDYSNNYLRKDIARNFCADCHGVSSLPKYAYFHELERTKHDYRKRIDKKVVKTEKIAEKLTKMVKDSASKGREKKTAKEEGKKLRKPSIVKMGHKIKKTAQKIIKKVKNVVQRLTGQEKEDLSGEVTVSNKSSSPHWKGRPIEAPCTQCHGREHGFRDKHPVSLKITEDKEHKAKTNEISCKTCHDPKIQASRNPAEQKADPFFLKKFEITYDFQKHLTDKTVDFSMVPDMNFIVNITSDDKTKDYQFNEKESSSKRNVDRSRVDSIKGRSFNICYKCHAIAEFLQFNPHINQQSITGELNYEVCLYCHYKIPSAKADKPKYYYLKHSLGKICIGCHPYSEKLHPGNITHFGKFLSRKYATQMQNYKIGAHSAFFPLDKNRKIICSTCHNPHQWGATTLKKTKVGSSADFRLRTDNPSICPICHTEKIRQMMENDLVFW
ncbi:MAG: cytochrome c3 family protein [bacterium]